MKGEEAESAGLGQGGVEGGALPMAVVISHNCLRNAALGATVSSPRASAWAMTFAASSSHNDGTTASAPCASIAARTCTP